MDFAKLVAALRRELEDIDAAIESLERLGRERPRRGRPPKSLSSRPKPPSDKPPSPLRKKTPPPDKPDA